MTFTAVPFFQRVLLPGIDSRFDAHWEMSQ